MTPEVVATEFHTHTTCTHNCTHTLTHTEPDRLLVIFLQFPCFYLASPGVVLLFPLWTRATPNKQLQILGSPVSEASQAGRRLLSGAPSGTGSSVCDRKSSQGGLTVSMAVAGAGRK